MVDTTREAIEKARDNLIFVLQSEEEVVMNPEREFKKDFAQRRYLYYPDEDKEWKYILQIHARSESLHVDYRAQISENEGIGITITVPFGLGEHYDKMLEIVKELEKDNPIYHDRNGEPRDKKERENMYEEMSEEEREKHESKIAERWNEYWDDELKDWFMDKWESDFLDYTQKHVVIEKATVPIGWFEIDQEIMLPGSVGSTDYEFASMFKLDEGRVQYGALKSDYLEHFWSGGDIYEGKVNFVQRPKQNLAKTLTEEQAKRLGDQELVWLHFMSKNQEPYMLKKDGALEKEWLPPEGKSALPEGLKKQVPEEGRYWEEGKAVAALEKASQWFEENKESLNLV